ncbi:hypothetical protein B0H14DRAFT_3485756 [Mycena olivaceomarginata]|nr:hypothetical protein B0H14DRAFT_3485756 [Mycena olivaceomarginata]
MHATMILTPTSSFPLPSPASSYIGGTCTSSTLLDPIAFLCLSSVAALPYVATLLPASSSPILYRATSSLGDHLPSSTTSHYAPFPGDTFDLHPNDAEPGLLVAKRVEFVWLLPLSAQTLPPALQATTAPLAHVACTPFLGRTCAAAGNLPPLVDRLPFIPPRQKLRVGRLRSPRACLRLPQASRIDGSFARVISIRVVIVHSTLIPPDGHGFNRQVQASLARSHTESKPDPHFPSALPHMLDHLAQPQVLVILCGDLASARHPYLNSRCTAMAARSQHL